MTGTRLFPRVGLGLLLVALAGYGSAAAQRAAPKTKAGHPEPKPHTMAMKPAEPPKSFKGIAAKLNTTPEALETQFETAHAANPKLTHGQFVAANVLANNLGTKHPSITVQAILDGLKSGKSIGQTLQSLQLSPAEAKEAERAANREIKAAEKAAEDAVKDAKKPGTHKDNPKKPEAKPPGR